MSHVMCHVSGVRCHMSSVSCHIFFFRQSGEVYWWRFCYQQGLPHLVFSSSVFSWFFLLLWFLGNQPTAGWICTILRDWTALYCATRWYVTPTPLSNPQSTTPSIPRRKNNWNLNFWPNPRHPKKCFFDTPQKRFSFGIGVSIHIGQESQCLLYSGFFLKSVVAVCCLPSVSTNPTQSHKKSINCPGLLYSF